MYTVYQHKNKINGKRYIGITKQKPESRWGINGVKYKECPRFFNAIKKYGWDSFEHTIVEEGLTKEEVCKKEIELIALYKTQNKKYGYNITEGGESPTLPIEVREKMSKSMMGNTNGLGHKCSEEKKEKIRAPQIGRQFTDEHKRKLSEAAKLRHVHCSDEKKKKLSASYPHKKRVYCFETDTIYESVHDCARQLNIQPTLVSKVCQGKQKATGGYHLKYFDNTLNA